MQRYIAGFLLVLFSSLLFPVSNTLTGVKVIPLPNDKVRVDFIFLKPLETTPASFITEKPFRVVLDFMDVNNDAPKEQLEKTIKIGALVRYNIVSVGERVRAVLLLAASVPHSTLVTDCVYSIILSGKGYTLFEPRKELFVTNQKIDARYDITNVDFRGTGKNGGRVVLNVSSGSIPVEVTQAGRNVVATFVSTTAPQSLRKRYDVQDFQSPARFMTLTQDGKNTVLTIKNRGDYGYFAYQVNKQFIVDIFPLTEEEIKQAKLKKAVYTGKLISLNFQNIPVRSVLQLLADFTGTNMVVSDDVKGDITLRLNNTPWDQALDIILQTNSLDKRRKGNILMIAPASELVKREKEELRSQQEVTNLAPLRSELLQLNYAKASDIATLLKDKNTSILSKRGSISVDARTNTIWIQDTGIQIDEIRELVKRLDIPVKQVLIEARIVDVTKNFERDLGVMFGISRPTHLSGTLSGANQLAQGVSAANVTPFTDRLNVDLPATPALGTAASVGIALAKLGDGILLDLELSALESLGRGEVIASPRLITTNQQPAVIEAGQEIPYQESTSSGATAVAFKKAVLSLKVTPQITPDGKIMMDLQVNQDTPSAQTYNGVPAINTKEIQTNVLVENGQTIVLGGIYQQDKSATILRVPFLGQLPVVGALFRSETVKTSNEELLIFITPRIITNTLSITGIEGRTSVDLDETKPWK